MERRGFLATLLVSPAVLVIAALVGAPLVLAAYLSFTDASGIAHRPLGRPRELPERRSRPDLPGRALAHVPFHRHLAGRRDRLRRAPARMRSSGSSAGRWLFRFFILLPWAAPIALTAIGFLWFYDPQASIFNWFLIKLHLVDPQHLPNWLGTPKAAMSSIITVQAWRTIPFATVIFIAGISSIPEEVDDAAAIDGATGLRKFWFVSLPLQLPIASWRSSSGSSSRRPT